MVTHSLLTAVCAEKAWRTHDAVPRSFWLIKQKWSRWERARFLNTKRWLRLKEDVWKWIETFLTTVWCRGAADSQNRARGRSRGSGLSRAEIGTEFHQHFHWPELSDAQLTCGLTPLLLWKKTAKFRVLRCATDGREVGNFLSPGFWWNTLCLWHANRTMRQSESSSR